VVLVAMGLLAGACTSAPPEQPPPSSAEASDPVEPDEPAAEPDPEPEPVSAEDELLELWSQFHEAWVEQAAAAAPDESAFTDLAVDPASVVADMVALRLETQTVTTEFELWSSIDAAAETASITDCVIATQHPEGSESSAATVSIRWAAEAIATDDGWRIDTARQLELFCVAEELNDQLLTAYRDYRTGLDLAWDPPDPEHPALEQTMDGEQLEFIRTLLVEHRADGIVIREPAPTDNAVVWRLGIGTATVSDCTEQVEEYGAFDLETGERLDLIPPAGDGRLDAQSVELQRAADGAWKVVDQAGTRDTECVPGSTRYATP
jgi:hypothetical protein